ncbi:PTS lactose/cellobiose transporter subunit IIA [Enterococcus massiliensis]|uniref:PTS lactose/cellobiose transporter subunit IIA n=1 Tax=Enterococcus massiliensis TaxID=1640685 RepID=UPI00065E33C5|nr:PTS lactose/cellobiose transporter subunit IIA [Enterococcus massiliensis]
MSTEKIKALAFQISYVSDDASEEFRKGIESLRQKNLEKMIQHIKQGQEHLALARTLQTKLLQEDIDRLPYAINELHVVDNFCEASVLGRCGQYLLEVMEKQRMREVRRMKRRQRLEYRV